MTKEKSNKFLWLTIISLAVLLCTSTAFAASVTLSWNAPTLNEDGSQLNDLNGYVIYYGTSSDNYTQSVDVGNVNTYQLSGLNTGTTYYLAATAYDTSGNESATSNEITRTAQSPDTTPPVMSSIQVNSITVNSSAISWATNEAADTQIQYGTTTSYGSSTSLNSTMSTSHSQSVNGLSASTLYHYRVLSRDAAGNLASSSDYTFTTTTPQDTTAPVISSVQSSGITSSAATISWITNEDANTQVQYGTTTSYGSSTSLNSTMSTSHSQSVSSLSASTLYHYRVLSRDAAGNLKTSGDYTFTSSSAPDTTAPVISSVQSSSITSSAATISWITNEAANTQVQYGTTTSYGSSTSLNSTMSTSHNQSVSSLSASTLYHYRVLSRDAAGNLKTSGDYTFTASDGSVSAALVGYWKFDEGTGTNAADSSGNGNNGSINGPIWTNGIDGGALEFDGLDDYVQIGTSNMNTNSGTLSLWVNSDNFIDNQYIFGHTTTPAYQERIQLYTDDTAGNLDLGLGDTHITATAIQDLGTNAWYHFALVWDGGNYNVYVDGILVRSGQYAGLSNLHNFADIGNNGNASDRSEAWDGLIDEVSIYNRALNNSEISDLYSAIQQDTTPPSVSSVATSNITSTSVTVNWTTNEDSNTQIEYGTTISYGTASTLNPAMATSHSQSISGLSASTLYHYRVLSRDTAGNLATTGDYTFTTSAAPDTTAPVISSVQSTGISTSASTIGWTTNEVADTQIQYGTTSSYGSATTLNSALSTSHSQSINGLSASTLYHYRVLSRDIAGNLATTGDYTFTTSAAIVVEYYCDNDNDGYVDSIVDGSCTGTGCEPGGCQTTAGNDCNDTNGNINPGENDDTCDGVDDNCDGTADNNYVTAVTSCGTGVCSAVGQLECQNGTEVNTCAVGLPTESVESTCDGQDNDCDGLVDEVCSPSIKVSSVILSEDFSSGIPTEWSAQGAWDADNTCGQTIEYPFTGSFAIADSTCNTTGDDSLSTGSFDTLSCSSVELTFSNQYFWYSGNVDIDVSSDGGATWTNNLYIDSDDGYPTPSWKDVDISSIADSGDAQVRFRYLNSTGNGFWALDNVWVTCQSSQTEFSSTVAASSTRTIMVSNSGNQDLDIGTIVITGTDASDFSLTSNDDCSNQTLSPAESCTVDIAFSPSSTGSKSASLTISSNDPLTPTNDLPLSGTGTAAVNPAPVIKANGSSSHLEHNRNDTLEVTIELDPGHFNGQDADWWVLMEHRNRIYYYDAQSQKWRRGSSLYRQGVITTTGPITVKNESRSTKGLYTYFFGVDTVMNGTKDSASYVVDTVTVNVN